MQGICSFQDLDSLRFRAPARINTHRMRPMRFGKCTGCATVMN